MIFAAIISSFLFSICNRIRGGWIVNNYNRILALCLLFFGVLCISKSIILTPIIIIGWFIGSLMGWGRAIGAAGGWETRELQENKYIDWITNKIINDPYKDENHLRLWGTVWLTFRGMLWGLCILLPVGILMIYAPFIIPFSLFKLCYIFLGFSCMGLIYESVSLITNNNKMWEVSEFVYGFVMGFVISFLL